MTDGSDPGPPTDPTGGVDPLGAGGPDPAQRRKLVVAGLLGALVVAAVVAFVLLSEITKAWLIYVGLVFMVMVMFAPGGISSLIMMNLRVAAFRKWGRLALPYLGLAVTLATWMLGAAAIIEMVYHYQLDSNSGEHVKFMGLMLNIKSMQSWLGSLAVFAVGFALFEVVRRHFKRRWGAIQEEIELELRRRGVA